MNILVVDDHRDTADAIQMLLGLWGHHVRTAYRGAEAVEVARAFVPHIAFVDLELPDLSGVDVARALRAQRSTPLIVIALSGRSLRDGEAEFDRYMRKPVAATQLFSCCCN